MGTLVATMLGTPPEPEQRLSWELVYGVGDVASFGIDAVNASVRTLNGSFDFEQVLGPVYVRVRATDDGQGALSSIARLAVRIVDVNEPPVCPLSVVISVRENAPVNATVGPAVAAVDLDALDSPNAGKLVYSFVGAVGAFTVDAVTGQVAVAAATFLDFETRSQYFMTLGE